MKHRKLTICLVIALALASFFIIQPAFAIENQVPAPKLKIPIPGMAPFSDVNSSNGNIASSWIAEYIVAIYRYGIGIIGLLAMIMIAVGGVRWVISQGNPGKVGEAKGQITGALSGVALALGSYMLLSLINTDLVNFRPLNIGLIEKPDFSSAGGVLTGDYTGKPSFSNNNSTYDSMLRQAVNQFNNGQDCNLAKAIMMTESAGNPKAASKDSKGQVLAKGLMQTINSTFTRMNVGSDPFDPQTSINAGVKYLSQLKRTACNGGTSNSVGCISTQTKYIAAAYNGGPGANAASKRSGCSGKTAWECPANWDRSRSNSYLQTYNYVGKVQANLNLITTNGWGC